MQRQKLKIKNPILCGFNPDPSIIYANGYYYIATSTFEYYPGVQIHKSKDLTSFEVVARPVTKINMAGNPVSGGVWAPCLSYDGKLFYLIYSNLTNWAQEPYKDCANFVITATDIEGQWSEPKYLSSHGFDASLFHDDDGKKYFLSVGWDYRKAGTQKFGGILLFEYDQKQQRLVGEPTNIFQGTDRGLVEGPHIYKKDGYYYLFTAEGGTGVEHAETVARSKNIRGPYELHPQKHIITSFNTQNPLQKAGHGSLCQGAEGEWYMAHLCGRKRFANNCVLGRETALQNIEWVEGWPYIAGAKNEPRQFFEVYADAPQKPQNDGQIKFTPQSLKTKFQFLREDITNKLTIVDQNTLKIVGGQSIHSEFEQNAVLVRQQHFRFEASVKLKFEPQSHYHMAGLLYRYNEDNQYLLYSSFDEQTNKKQLAVQCFKNGSFCFLSDFVDYEGDVILRLNGNFDKAEFCYSVDGGKSFKKIGGILDASILSDEYASPMGFTGAFIGLYAGDLAFRQMQAEFSNFFYIGEEQE